MKLLALKLSLPGLLLVCLWGLPAQAEQLKVAHFQADATPALGTYTMYAVADHIDDPLSARGIVLLGTGQPIVQCAVDWIGIANGGQDEWRSALAKAAGTSVDRITVHTLHQHDAPLCDFAAEELLREHGLKDQFVDTEFARQTIRKTAQALQESLKKATPVTHLGTGQAKVEKVASNRRILGEDGKVKIIRWSKSRIPEAIAAPEGVIDPQCKVLSLWNEDQPIVLLTYYAVHPQSYYGMGGVSADFVGLARAEREKQFPQVAHIHFNGASGNVAAGKYNDGSVEMRPVLTSRLADGMRRAWEATEKQPLTAEQVEWRTLDVQLPVGLHLEEQSLLKKMDNEQEDRLARIHAGRQLTWLRRQRDGEHPVTLSCLILGPACVVHMPGELFIEYQLAAQKMRPDDFVCMAAYGEYGCGYIGTEIAYSRGGYETSERASAVAPRVEQVLIRGLTQLLK